MELSDVAAGAHVHHPAGMIRLPAEAQVGSGRWLRERGRRRRPTASPDSAFGEHQGAAGCGEQLAEPATASRKTTTGAMSAAGEVGRRQRSRADAGRSGIKTLLEAPRRQAWGALPRTSQRLERAGWAPWPRLQKGQAPPVVRAAAERWRPPAPARSGAPLRPPGLMTLPLGRPPPGQVLRLSRPHRGSATSPRYAAW